MNKVNDRTAFPIVADSLTHICDPGMTLRDYFAAKAMEGLLAGTLSPTILWSQQEMAGLSYQMADAMLKAREE